MKTLFYLKKADRRLKTFELCDTILTLVFFNILQHELHKLHKLHEL